MTPKMTASGYSLMTGALSGETIEFTKIVIGNGNVPDDYRILNDLQNPLLTAEITDITRDGNFVILKAPILNDTIEGRLTWTELGVFAKDPAGGEDILYGYAHSALSGDGKGFSIPEYNTNLIELVHKVYVYVGEVENVTAVLLKSSEYASAHDLSEHISNRSNPHGVTKKDVGLDNVPNVSTNNQTPTYYASAFLAKLVSGEKLSIAFGKIAQAINSLIDHLRNYKNPHRVSYKDVGAAEKDHTHSANDINIGVLGIARGGTGASTKKEALLNLGAAPAGYSEAVYNVSDEEAMVEQIKKIYDTMKDDTSKFIVMVIKGDIHMDITIFKASSIFGYAKIVNCTTHNTSRISLLSTRLEDGTYTDIHWSDIEYENPNLSLGMEYRTTDRYLGKPVYTKLLNAGIPVSGAAIELPDNVELLRHEGRFNLNYPFPIGDIAPGSVYAYSYRSAETALTRIILNCTSQYVNNADYEWYEQVWYVKQ